MIRALFRQPHPDEPATFAGTVQDVLAGLSITAFGAVVALWIVGVFG
jgi:hypothetical protein